MFMLVAIFQVVVTLIIMSWILKRKTGEKFTKKAVAKFLVMGFLSFVLGIILANYIPTKEVFSDLNPLLGGFLSAFLLAALYEEILKYLFFRLALFKNREAKCWLDVVIVAVVVAIGFTLLEDIEYVIAGVGNIIRALIPGHILFQIYMGYFYGKARVTGKFRYHVLSLAVPILLHTLFDMFIIGLLFIIKDPIAVRSMTNEQIMALPNVGFMVPLTICTVITLVGMFVLLIISLKNINTWSKKGQKQELLNPAPEN